jgi:hypothetical protein
VPYSLATNDGKCVRGAAQTGDGLFDLLYGEVATQPKMMSVGIHLRLTGHVGRAVWRVSSIMSRHGPTFGFADGSASHDTGSSSPPV